MMRTLQQRLPHSSLFFGYGPTEASEHVTCKAFKELGSGPLEVPILVGKPIPHTHIYIVDGQRQPVPIGVHGELLTSGIGLARGYLNRPDLAKEAFVPNTLIKDAEGYFSSMYSTGASSCQDWRNACCEILFEACAALWSCVLRL